MNDAGEISAAAAPGQRQRAGDHRGGLPQADVRGPGLDPDVADHRRDATRTARSSSSCSTCGRPSSTSSPTRPAARRRPATARRTGSTSTTGCSRRAGTTRACASSTSPTRATSSRSATTRRPARSGPRTSRPRPVDRLRARHDLGHRRAQARRDRDGAARAGLSRRPAQGPAFRYSQRPLGLRLPAPALIRSAAASSPPP